MTTAPLIPGQHVHIVGISGFGMSAIARVLLETGYTVSGSDRQLNDLSAALRDDGATIHIGHRPENIGTAELVLVSSAVPSDNPELLAAHSLGVPVKERRQFIAALTEGQRTIAIAGTHGKTTTTAMLVHIFSEAGLDPSFIVGGILKGRKTNAGAGQGEHFIIEADEYGHMFLGLNPALAIINNVEYDHPDYFSTPQDLLTAFQDFTQRIKPKGVLFANMDDDIARAFAEERRAAHLPTQTFGVENSAADWWAIDLVPNQLGGTDFVACRGSRGTTGAIGPVHLCVPGRHNVYNAMAAIALARHEGVPFEVIAQALTTFKGTGRRSELMGEAGGVRVISDYAHHPTAIQATLRAWQEQLGSGGRLWAVWQPHTYSRTRALADAFAGAFGAADLVLVTQIYAAREQFTPGLDAKDLAAMIQRARFSGDLSETAQLLSQEVQPGDVVLLMSAGDAPKIGDALLAVLRKRG